MAAGGVPVQQVGRRLRVVQHATSQRSDASRPTMSQSPARRACDSASVRAMAQHPRRRPPVQLEEQVGGAAAHPPAAGRRTGRGSGPAAVRHVGDEHPAAGQLVQAVRGIGVARQLGGQAGVSRSTTLVRRRNSWVAGSWRSRTSSSRYSATAASVAVVLRTTSWRSSPPPSAPAASRRPAIHPWSGATGRGPRRGAARCQPRTALGLVHGELEVGVADLAQATGQPEAPERHRRVRPGAQHDGEGGRDRSSTWRRSFSASGERSSWTSSRTRTHEPGVSERERLVERGRGHPPAAPRFGHRRRAGQGRDDRPGQPARLVVAGVEGDPCGPPVGRPQPRRDERGLPGPRQPGHQGDVAPAPVVEQVLQPAAGDQRVRQGGYCVPGREQAVWVDGHDDPPGEGTG